MSTKLNAKMLPERFLPTADLDGQFGADVDFKASDVFVFVFLFLFLAICQV